MSKTKVGFGRIWNKEPESDFGSYTVRTLEI